jgi:cytoskeletal protein CcmA (bactofilin family)
MTRLVSLIVALSLLPCGVSAATVVAEEALTISEASSGNAYLAGSNVRVTAPVSGDVSALAADIILLAPVNGDALLVGGNIEAGGSLTGDLRAFGGRVNVKGNADGDIFATGWSVRVSGKGSDMRIGGVNVEVTGGSDGPVAIFGSSVTLGGEFAGNVEVFASDHLTLLPSARILGSLEYDAPQQADIQEGAVIMGDVAYTGSASFLPTKEEAQTFALAGAGFFLIVRILSGMVASGLVAGLFPAFANDVASRILMRSWRKFILLALLGFSIAVAAPILAFFLAASFVGFGIALIIGSAYILLALLSYFTAGILVGALIARLLFKRQKVTWRFALLGALVLSLIGMVPFVGTPITVLLTAASAGAIIASCYRFAFGRDSGDL